MLNRIVGDRRGWRVAVLGHAHADAGGRYAHAPHELGVESEKVLS